MAGIHYLRYGRVQRRGKAPDALLDRFMPAFDIVERHQTEVDAPAEVTFAVASEMDFQRSCAIRAIFRARELAMGGATDPTLPRPLIESMKAMGWGVLAGEPGREIVMGAITKPWEAKVTFRALPPEQFASFDEPGWVKIAWTLRADPAGSDRSAFRTETRAIALGPFARWKFRRYWSLVAPGVGLIRWFSLGLVRSEARKRWLESAAITPAAAIP